MAIVAWKEKAERAARALARVREYTEDAVVQARYDAEAILAGTAAGAIRGSFEATGKDYSLPGPGGMKIEPEMVIGGALLALAFAKPDRAPGQGNARDFHSLGSGILAYSGGRQAEQYMRTRATKGAGK